MSKKKKRMSRKAKRRMLQKAIPILVAIVLIIIIVLFSFGSGILDKIGYSNERANLYEVFGITSEEEVPVIMDNQISDIKAIYQNNRYYLTDDLIKESFFSNYYYDDNEKKLIYTSANEIFESDENSGDFITREDVLYIALDYVEKYAPIEIISFSDPNRIEILYKEENLSIADVKEDTQIRVSADKKSDIICDVPAKSSIVINNSSEDWSEVVSESGFIGFIENKMIVNNREELRRVNNDNIQELNIVHTLRDHKICLGWHQVMSKEANETFDSVVNQTKGMNVISPTWFSVINNQGEISNIGTQEYVSKAHNAGMEVWGLVDNFSPEIDSYEILSHTTSRRYLESSLISAAKALGIDGINIDFENLPTQAGDSFAQFIRELSISCRENGIVLSVDNYVPREYTSYYKRDIQGLYADYIIIMGYDEHYVGSEEIGSVASFDFVQEGIEKTILDVSPSQVINGVPFYTRIWSEGAESSSEAVGMEMANNFVSEHGINLTWDEKTAQNFGQITEGNVTYSIWMEDAASIKAKLNLMSTFDIAGVACWKLGFETPDVWDEISEYLQK